MSQEEALNWLAAHPGWHKTVVIARGLRKRRHQVGPILTLEGLIEERRAATEDPHDHSMELGGTR